MSGVTAPSRTRLPRPTGAHVVGRTSIGIVDHARRDIYADDAAATRELSAWVWYPARSDARGKYAEHIPAAWTPIADQLGLDAAGLRTHAISDAPVADLEAPHPVLVMSPSGFSPLLLAAIAEELASAGYVVVGVNHTYEFSVTVLADGRVVAANPGAFGHSFGGNAAVEWCAADQRCLAAVNLDGAIWTDVVKGGLDRPALQILADHPEFDLPSDVAVAAGVSPDADWYEAERAIVHDGWRAVRELANPGVTAHVAGAIHMGFMDIPFLPLRPDSTVADALGATNIEPELMWRITSDLLLAFFGEHLRGEPGPSLGAVSSSHPEVTIITGREAS